VFLDRDGTLNVEREEWLTRPRQVELLPGVAAAVRQLNGAGLRVIVVTNQSGLAQGVLEAEELAAVHERLTDLLADEGAFLDGILYCPHGPEDDCECRKPRPGLLRWAAREMGFDLADSIMVGDAGRDVAAGHAAGCRAAVLVRTGKGRATEAELAGAEDAPTAVCDDLSAAAQWIVARCAA